MSTRAGGEVKGREGGAVFTQHGDVFIGHRTAIHMELSEPAQRRRGRGDHSGKHELLQRRARNAELQPQPRDRIGREHRKSRDVELRQPAAGLAYA